MTDTFPGADSPNYVDIGTGVKKWDVVEGVGTPVAAGGSVKVFYTLWLASTGQQVETNRNGTPLSSALSGLIVGWQEGVPGMKPGGIRRLVIPPEKGYGSGGTSTIPPNATLVFEIKLLTP
ncbi:MAG: FKBP-type peptidyl-prolyl cis-trans isomerase [Gemmataceae bacterium]|nr:FKBP-type peptidyl-prolyl cis-trans isomerase [Gemmataceae bacterium]